MMFARMPGRGSQSRARPLVERLDPRLIMDAPALPPEDDPLSPVGDPAPGDDLAGGEAVASSSCCSPCITYTVSVVRIETGAGPEDNPEIEGKFRFTAAASCNSGAPSSITVSYTLDESTATHTGNPRDFEGEITSGTVIIPLTNGWGYKEMGFSILDDAIDEVTEKIKVVIPRTEVINPTTQPNPPPVTASADIYDNDIEWRVGDPIEGAITPNTPEDLAVPINGTIGLSVEALDLDYLKDDDMLSAVYDDVTSGSTAEDFHISWTASGGTLIQNGEEVGTAYGQGVMLKAPDYAERPQSVTVTATVDDFNRAGDVDGFDDEPLVLQVQVPVWKVTLSVEQDEPWSVAFKLTARNNAWVVDPVHTP